MTMTATSDLTDKERAEIAAIRAACGIGESS